MIIRALDPHTDAALLPGLAAMMVKTVAGCASIGFMAGFDQAGALAWWRGRLAAAQGEAQGRTTLALATISGSAAARLYERAGWEKVGDIPAYALMPGGKMAPAAVYTKRLS
jgi:hypothetical protein